MNKLNFLIALFSLGCAIAHADENLSFRTGADVAHHKNTALYSLGYEEVTQDDLIFKVAVGYWTDSQDNHRSSPMAEVLIGSKLGDDRGVNIRPAVGVVFVGFTDDLLSTSIQFTEEVSIGFRGVGIGYKHVGLSDQGRNYLFVNLITHLF